MGDDRRKGGAGDKAAGAGKAADERARRLAEALRANLQKRKAQARARRHGDPDERPEGLVAGHDDGEG